MKNLSLLFLLSGFLVISSCNKPNLDDSLQQDAALKSGKIGTTFKAHLSGREEVPAVDTKATGEAIFKLSKDGMSLNYKLIVANIENVKMAHIHIGPAGANGPIAVWLYPSGPPPVVQEGTTNGILAQGVITVANLTADTSPFPEPALANEPDPLAALITAMKDGNAYVNAHTDAHGAGEIRGQISSN